MNIISLNIRFAGSWSFLLLSFFTLSYLSAGGIKNIAPTSADSPVMLETGREGFGSFADFGSDPESRLYVSFGQADEVLYIGLSPEYTNDGVPFSNNPTASRYQFRIRRDNPDGADPIVHGPYTITNLNANVNSYEEAEYGIYSTTQEIGGQRIFEFRPGAAGDYYIEFDESTSDGDRRVNIPFWDFTVVRGEQPIDGRIWSRGWAFRTPQVTGTTPPDCVWDREFNGKLYSYTEDGFVSLIDFNGSGFQGLSFNIAFNSTGPGTSGDLAEDRKSVPNENRTGNARQHRIFLTLPDIELFPDGICGEVTVGETFLCGGSDPYCIQVDVTRVGQVEILLDFNGNGILDDNSEDVNLVYEFTPGSLSACVPWNGLRGDSTPVDFTDTVDVYIAYSQGVQHWSAYDVEFMKNGFCVETVRPICDQTISSNFLYYDDREIPEPPGTGAPKDNREGCACTDNCRTWDNFQLNPGGTCDTFDDNETSGYGDKSTLNTWWFANSRTQFRARVPVISANISGPKNICEGQTVSLIASDLGVTGIPTYLWEGTGIEGATNDTVNISQAGEYCVTVFDPSGCSNRTCSTITVTNFDISPIPANLNVCFGEAVVLPTAGNPAYSYTWSPAIGIDDINSNQPTFNPLVTTTYTVNISTEGGAGEICETTMEVQVDVAPDIDLQVIGGGPICDPTTTFTATTAVAADVVLFDMNGMQIGTGNSFTVDVSGETDYLLVATNAQNCKDSITFTVSGGPVDINLPDTILTCLSDGVNLAVTNLDENDVLTYNWSPANIFTPESVNTASPVFIGVPGDYNASVTVTNQYGCEATEDVQIIVIDDNAALSFTSAVDCDGMSVTFTNTSTATFGYLYDFGDGTTSTAPNPVHIYDSPGTYSVTLSLLYDQVCITSFIQEVTTFPIVLDAAFSVALEGCNNGSATLVFTDNSLNATGADLTYEWTFSGTNPTSSSMMNPSVEILTSGTVMASLVVSSADLCTSSVDTSFTVNLASVNLQEEITICPGDSTELNPGGDPNLVYTWSPASGFDPNATNPTTSIPGTYIVSVTSTSADFNCTNVDTVNVVLADSIRLVINGPDGPLNGSGSGGGVIELPTVQTCGNSVELTADITTSNTDVEITYTDLDGNVLGTGGSFTLSPDGRDTVVVTAVNEFGCLERDTVVLINTQVDASIDVSANGLNFCSSTDTIVRAINNDPNDTLTYAWGANAIIFGSLINDFVNIRTPAEGSVDLQLTVTNQFGCDTMLTVTVSAIPFTPNQYSDAIQPCFKEQFTINGGPAVPGYTYVWTPSDDLDLTDPANPVGTFENDGTLMVTITDPLTGCEETQTISVDVSPEISFVASPQDTTLCAPGSVSINGSSVNENAEIIWYSDPELTNQVGSGSTYIVDAAETGQSYTVYGQATDPSTECTQVIPVTVTVSEITAGLPLDAIASCTDETPGIFGPGGPSGNLTYTYEPTGLIDDSNPLNPVFVGNENSTVTVTATDPATGCSITQDITITVTRFDNVTGMADPSTIFLGESTTLTVEGCESCTYEWFPPNGTITPNTGATVTATPDEAGTLTYEVEVTQNGCTQVVLIEVRVEDPLCDVDHIYVPNAFTPNGDNQNDVMRVRSNFAEQITEFRFIIYNRWGQEVYSSDDIFESWDGTIEGDDLEPDVYGYWLRVICPTGQELIQQGNISILR